MRKSLMLLLVGLLLAAACASHPTADAVRSPSETTNTASAESSPSAATRQPRLALESTDPSKVTLAAGKPQLIEFFAFW